MASFLISVEGLLEGVVVSGDRRKTLQNVVNVLHGLAGGSANALSGSAITAKLASAPVYATGTVVLADLATAGNTVTIAGQALTCTQHNATGTVTFATALADDTVTIGGVVFTAKASGATGLTQFNLGADDTAAAANLTTAVNNYNALQPAALPVTATSALGVVTFRATTGGTAGNSITLASIDNTRLQVSGATLAGGAAVANNQWDPGNTAATAAAALSAAVNASSTAAVSGNVTATVSNATVTLTARAPGNAGNVTLTKVGANISVSGATLTGGALGTSVSYGF